MSLTKTALRPVAGFLGLQIAVTLLSVNPVWANESQQQTKQEFSIPAQPLNEAINSFIETTDWQVGFVTAQAKGVQSKAVRGEYTKEQALKKMLEGTDIQYQVIADNSITLEKSHAKSITTEMLLAQAPKENYPATVIDNAEYEGPVEQEDLTVSGRELSGYSVINANTATKMDMAIMDTPVSVQVVPRSVMDDQKATRITDALENVSGVRPQSSLGTSTGFIIRGFRNSLVYRDGLLGVPNGFRTEFDTANLENIEVLKGPASILFGRIEPGGLINVSTKKPLDDPYYSLEQRFGSYDFYRTEWDATGPIVEDGSLLYRFTGAYQNSDSFRDFVSTERTVIAPSLTWRLTDATDFTVNVEYLDQDYQADYGIPIIGTRPANIPLTRSFGDPNDPVDNINKVILGTEFNHSFNDNWAIHNRFQANWGHGEETFLNPAPAFGNALDPNTGILKRNVFFQEYESESFATNLDLTGRFDIAMSKHEVLVGFDYLRSTTDYHHQGFFGASNPALDINIFNPGSRGIDPTVFSNAVATTERPGSNHSVFKDEWYGVYFQDHITLWDKLHILGGGRYDWVETGRGRAGNFNDANKDLPGNIRKDEGFSPRVGVLYQPWQWLGVYGNWTTSFGANNGVSATGDTFDPQIGEQYEAGIKTELFDGRFIATLAYYYLTKENILTPDLSTADPGDKAAVGKQRSQGIELDMSGQITEELSVIGSYAFTDARITKDNSGLQGNRMNNVPEHSGSLWLKYDVKQIASLRGLSFGVGAFAVGEREGDNKNSFQLPGYVRLDAFTAYQWKLGNSKVTAQFNIKNLLDKEYFESTDPSANVTPRNGAYPGAPLTAMGSIRLEF